MAGNKFVRVDDVAVSSFLNAGEPVAAEVDKIAKLTKYFSQGFIHDRTGKLGRGIQANRTTKTGPFTGKALVFTRTSYALFVHDGTANDGVGYIYPANGKYLTVPKNHKKSVVSGGTLRTVWRRGSRETAGTKPYFTALRVHGQKANPFLEKGLHEAMGTL